MNIAIALVTNSKYIDVCKLFLTLKTKNWPDCIYNTILTYTGERLEKDGIQCATYYNGQGVSLPGCIYNTAHQFNLDYCICFLGDAFIYKRVDNKTVNKIIAEIIENEIDYCRLYELCYNTEKIQAGNHLIRPFSYKDRGVSFVAFIVSSRFIETEFFNNVSDYDFEMKYLRYTNLDEAPVEWQQYKMNTVVGNKFHIVPGITQGKWDRDAYRRIKKYNPDVKLPELPMTPLHTHIIRKIAYSILNYIPTRHTKKIKSVIKKMKLYNFASDE